MNELEFIGFDYMIDDFLGVYGVLFLELRFQQCHSLKAKRGILKPLINKVKKQHNVSVAELDYQDKWQHALIGIAHIGSSRLFVEQSLRALADEIEDTLDGEVILTKVNII